MKTGKTFWTLTLAIATMGLLTQRAHALFTPELTFVSNQVAFYATTLTNADDKAEAKAVAGALKALSKPSDSIAEDYDRFVSAALKLGDFALQPPFGEIGSNTFTFFMQNAFGQIGATAARIAALNDFVKTKKSASNQLALAVSTLNSAVTNPNPQLALLQGRQVFTRIATANKLAAVGEAHSGLALDSVAGKTVTYTEGDESGTLELFANGDFIENGSGSVDGTYTYTRTGLNSATLVLTDNPGGDVTTVELTFKTETSGKFSAEDEEGKSKGTFTVASTPAG